MWKVLTTETYLILKVISVYVNKKFVFLNFQYEIVIKLELFVFGNNITESQTL
jgi:hypothetical protein